MQHPMADNTFISLYVLGFITSYTLWTVDSSKKYCIHLCKGIKLCACANTTMVIKDRHRTTNAPEGRGCVTSEAGARWSRDILLHPPARLNSV